MILQFKVFLFGLSIHLVCSIKCNIACTSHVSYFWFQWVVLLLALASILETEVMWCLNSDSSYNHSYNACSTSLQQRIRNRVQLLPFNTSPSSGALHIIEQVSPSLAKKWMFILYLYCGVPKELGMMLGFCFDSYAWLKQRPRIPSGIWYPCYSWI
jgi:hypothetical protein